MVNQKNVNILHKLHNRELTGRVTRRPCPREPELKLCEPRQPWYYLPLKSILDTHKTLLRGHVLLGFLKDGIHLISYLCQVESSDDDILHSLYSYSLYIWRFDLGSPLQKACTYRLFEGETITCDLQLVISETGESDRIVVLGVPVNSEEESRQCLVSILPSPERMIQSQTEMHGDEFFVHFKYEVQPPYPPFSPVLSLQLKDSVICNTGDSLTVVTVTPHRQRSGYHSGTVPPSPAPSSTASHSSEGESDVSDIPSEPTKKMKYSCSCPFLRSSEHLSTCILGRLETVQVAQQCDMFCPIVQRKRIRRRYLSQSPKVVGERKNAQVDSVTTFSTRIYGLSVNAQIPPRTRYDATQTLYPLNVTSLVHNSLRLTHTQLSDTPYRHTHTLPDDLVSVKQISFDAELYINSAVNQSEGLAARYSSLRDYDMRLLDVCTGTNSVVVLIMVLCLADHESDPNKQVLISSGFILSWNIESGAAKTLEYLPVEEFASNPCSVKRWNPGAGKALELRKRFFVPTAYNKTVRAFSNASVFSGRSLSSLAHPYLPVAIIM